MKPKFLFEGDYVRVHVRVLLKNPLVRYVTLMVKGEGRK